MASTDIEEIFLWMRRLHLHQYDLSRATKISESRISKILREHIDPKSDEIEMMKSALHAFETE